MVWTPPTHVAANGRSDSDKFNTETVDNLTHLHGQVATQWGQLAAIEVPDVTWVSVPWGFTVEDTGHTDVVDGYPERVAPLLPGYWWLNVRIQWPAGTGNRAVRIQKNGTGALGQATRSALVTACYTSVTTLAQCNGTTDFLNVHVWQNSGATVTIPALLPHYFQLLLPRG